MGAVGHGGGGGGTSVNFVLLKFKYGKGRPLLSSTPIPCLCVNVRYCCGDVFFAWRIFFLLHIGCLMAYRHLDS